MDIEPQLLKRLRVEARRRSVSFKDLLHGLLRRGLEDRPPSGGSRVSCPTFAMGPTVRGLELDKALGLAAADGTKIVVSRMVGAFHSFAVGVEGLRGYSRPMQCCLPVREKAR